MESPRLSSAIWPRPETTHFVLRETLSAMRFLYKYGVWAHPLLIAIKRKAFIPFGLSHNG